MLQQFPKFILAVGRDVGFEVLVHDPDSDGHAISAVDVNSCSRVRLGVLSEDLNDLLQCGILPLRADLDTHGATSRTVEAKRDARARVTGRGFPTAQGSLLRAAPSGLTRFTISLCVGPLPIPRRGRACLAFRTSVSPSPSPSRSPPCPAAGRSPRLGRCRWP